MRLPLFANRLRVAVDAVAIGVAVGVPIRIDNTVGGRDRLTPLRLRVSNVLPRHLSAHDSIPVNEEWLRKVLLDSDRLVVDVVVVGVVAEQELERVERKGVPTVVVDRLERSKSEEKDVLSR